MPSVTVYAAAFGYRPMVLSNGRLYLAPGDMAGTKFETLAEAEKAIEASVEQHLNEPGSLWADPDSYSTECPAKIRRGAVYE